MVFKEELCWLKKFKVIKSKNKPLDGSINNFLTLFFISFSHLLYLQHLNPHSEWQFLSQDP